VIKAFDFQFDQSENTHEVIVGRDNGVIEIYSYDDKSSVPTLRFETKVEESITGIDTGFIGNPQKCEVLISTYSGKIMALVDSKTFKQPLVGEEGKVSK
jgi:hypothetical protein